MARRSRYEAYAKALMEHMGQEKKQSSPKSILKQLQEYKEQNVVICNDNRHLKFAIIRSCSFVFSFL